MHDELHRPIDEGMTFGGSSPNRPDPLVPVTASPAFTERTVNFKTENDTTPVRPFKFGVDNTSPVSQFKAMSPSPVQAVISSPVPPPANHQDRPIYPAKNPANHQDHPAYAQNFVYEQLDIRDTVLLRHLSQRMDLDIRDTVLIRHLSQ